MDYSVMSTEEILNAHKKWSYVRTDRNGTRYFNDCTCGRCGGRGYADAWKYTGGVCYECRGSGVSKAKTIKVYTKEHEAELAAQREVRAEKARQARKATFSSRVEEFLIKNHFTKEGDEFVVYRVKGETYTIREVLKSLGCYYVPSIGWYSTIPLDEYEIQRMVANQLIVTDDEKDIIQWKDKIDCEQYFDQEEDELLLNEWIGEKGQKVRVTVTVKNCICSRFTTCGHTVESTMYLMMDSKGRRYKWSSSGAIVLHKGETYTLIGTVKDHDTYNGIKQTALTRCKIEEN